MGIWQEPSSMVNLTRTSSSSSRLSGVVGFASIKSRFDGLGQLNGPVAIHGAKATVKFRNIAQAQINFAGYLRADLQDVSHFQVQHLAGGHFQPLPFGGHWQSDIVHDPVPFRGSR